MAPRLPKAADLFPSHAQGSGPRFSDGPIWSLLDPTSPDGLRAQLLEAIGSADGLIGAHGDHYTVNEQEGRVAVHRNAVVEHGAHLIGPCLIEAGAVVRHGAYVRP